MKKIELSKRFQKYISIIIVAVITITSTGCPPCKECHETQVMNDEKAKKRQEALAQQPHPFGNKAGMVFGFSTQTNNNKEQVVKPAPVTAPVTVYRDLSLHYNFFEEKKNCPMGLQSAHTNISAGPNVNFKSAGSDVYAEGSHKPGVGFQVGFQTVYRFSEKFSVVPGIGFKQNNAKEVGEINEGGEPPYNQTVKIEDKYSYNYLSAPILAQYNLTENLSLSAGPEINYLLSSKVKSNTSYAGNDHTETIKLTKESVKLGLGIQAGVKYDIPNSLWGVELLYDHRLSRLNKKNPNGYPYEVPAWKMKSVQLSAKCRICDLLKGSKKQ